VTIVNIAVEKVLDDPERAVQHLLDANIYGLTDAKVAYEGEDRVTIWVTLEPWAAPAAQGYATERVAITIWGDGRIQAVPANGNRPFLHRYPPKFPGELIQALCLWYPNDPRALRWAWSDGLAAYVTIVHRHLQAEECWRRHGVWPGEDAPHGYGDHPIRTPALHRLLAQGGTQ
jgi:hypothetical protein